MKVKHFKSPAEFRAWLEKHHATERELWVGYYKKSTGRPSMTWPESVEQALCFGWIDGVRRSVDEDSYTIRFTPRKATSIWSAINLRKVKELVKSGHMRPAGYRRSALGWVTGAKRPETRAKRLAELIAVSAEGRRLPQYDWQKK